MQCPWTGDMICGLYAWQGLAGAFLGVMGAFLVAWWAASATTRRDQKNAATELIQELVEFAATSEGSLEYPHAPKSSIGHLTQIQSAALAMVHYRPRLSSLFYANAARLRTLDPVLVTRIAAVRHAFEAADRKFTQLDEADRLLRTTGDATYDEDAIRSMLDGAASLTLTAIREARATAADLEQLFIKRWSWLRRLGLRTPFVQRRRIAGFQAERAERQKSPVSSLAS